MVLEWGWNNLSTMMYDKYHNATQSMEHHTIKQPQ